MENNTTGAFLAAERKAKGLTQKQLAERLHVSDKAVSRWETGRGLPDAALMLPLCEILGISVNELLSGRRIAATEQQKAADKNLLRLIKENSRFKIKQLAGAIISAVLIILLMLGLYRMDFCVDVTSTQKLEAAIDAYDDPERQSNVDVLEMEREGRYLFVLFSAREEYSTGLATLERGIFGEYRFLSCSVTNEPLYTAQVERASGKSRLLIYGANKLPGVASFALYDNWERQGEPVYKSAAPDAPFLTILQEPGIQAAQWFRYYDAAGNELDDRELRAELTDSDHIGGHGTGTAELFMLYVWEGILLLLGVTFVRYFLSPPKEEKDE